MPDESSHRPRLLPTGEAARRVGVAPSTLARWWKEGRVSPEMTTAGGHGRWDIDDLRDHLRRMRGGGA